METRPDAGPPEPNGGWACPDCGAAMDLDAAGAGQWEATCDACGRTWLRSVLLRAVPVGAVLGPPADPSVPIPWEGVAVGLALIAKMVLRGAAAGGPAGVVLLWVGLALTLLAYLARFLRSRQGAPPPRMPKRRRGSDPYPGFRR